MENFQRDLEAFEKLNTQVIGVSNDELETLQDFVEEHSIQFPLATDAKKEIKKNYGSGRITYLIDQEGIIRFIQKGVPDNELFLEQLKKLMK